MNYYENDTNVDIQPYKTFILITSWIRSFLTVRHKHVLDVNGKSNLNNAGEITGNEKSLKITNIQINYFIPKY